jgi:transposase
MLSSSLDAARPTPNTTGGKRSRRVWSAEEKLRIADEAIVPGASVAEIARRHGVNANLVFTWRRAAQRLKKNRHLASG